MHIYSNEIYSKKQKMFIEKKYMKNLNSFEFKKKSSVFKNYVYYCEPVKIN